MSTKLIENVNEATWRRFAGLCKARGVLIGDKLTEVLEGFLKNEGM